MDTTGRPNLQKLIGWLNDKVRKVFQAVGRVNTAGVYFIVEWTFESNRELL